MKVKLSVWAKLAGVSFKTAQRWFYAGKMPAPTERTPTNRIMVCVDDPAEVEKVLRYVEIEARLKAEDK